MSRRKPERRNKLRSPREWIGGHFTVPGVVTDEPVPYHVELVLWVDLAAGAIIAHAVAPVADLEAAYGRSLSSACSAPAVGPPRRPARVRIASARFAAEVARVAGPDIEVTIAPTPELDALAADLLAHARKCALPEDDEPNTVTDFTSGSYFQGGLVSPAHVEDLFSAARFLRALAP